MKPMDGLMSRGNRPLIALGTILLLGWAAAAGIRARSQATVTPEPQTPASTRSPTNAEPSDLAPDDRNSKYNKHLTDEQYRVTRQRGREVAGTGKYWKHEGVGLYKCVCCRTSLFDSRAKFPSPDGWPSFNEPIDENAVDSRVDATLLDQRTEVICRKCQAHLGHVYSDGPRPTGLRYSINSAALDFEETMAPSK
jgi:peptide-methionine (R)-S-oxide reductase